MEDAVSTYAAHDFLTNHPLVAVGTLTREKTTERHWDKGKHDWVIHDLSPYDFAFRSRWDFGVKLGYTKEGDGRPIPSTGLQRSHLWVNVTDSYTEPNL